MKILWAYEYCKETTFHGLCHIEKGKPFFLRLFYLFIFLLGIAVTCTWHYGSVSEYLSRKTSTEYKLTSYPYVTIPNLALCSTNRFNRTKVKELNISDDLLHVFHQDMILSPTTLFVPGVSGSERQEMLKRTLPEYQALKSRLGILDHSEIMDRLYARCEDMIVECRDNMGMLLPCCSAAKTVEFFTGSCVVLPKHQQLNGFDSGVQIGIKFPKFEEMTPSKNGPMTTDIWVYLMENDDLYDLSTEHMVVERGHQTTIRISKTIIQSINNPPHFECKTNSEYKPLQCLLQCVKVMPDSSASTTAADATSVCASMISQVKV